MLNVLTSLSNLNTNVDDLGVSRLKVVPADFKKISDLVDNEVVKTQNSTQ